MVTRSEDEQPPSDNESDGLSYVDIENDAEEKDSLFSNSPQPEEGRERWRASEPPPEVFGDGEWAFEIIGEEVDKDGQILFEVRWQDWHREDGTNTTWETAETIEHSRWKKSQKRRRKLLVSQSLEIDVLTTTDIHNTMTYLRSQAFEEKLEKARSDPEPDPFAEMAKLMSKHQGQVQPTFPNRYSTIPQGTQGSSSSPIMLRGNQRASTRQQTENSMASSSTFVTGSSRVSSTTSVTLSSLPSKPSLPSSFKTSSKPPHDHGFVAPIPSLAKGKAKEVPPLDNPELHSTSLQRLNSSLSHSTTSSAKGKGKRPAPLLEGEGSDASMSSVHPNSSQHPFLSPSAKKRRTRIIRSESSEDYRISLSPTPLSPPIRVGPPKTRKFTPGTPANGVSAAKRMELRQAWSYYAKKEGAAPIYFINDIDDEAIPVLDPSFRYLESRYLFSQAVVKPDAGFLTSCSCDYCIEARHCDCQVISELRNEQDVPFFAYTHSGLFAFKVPKGVEVVECNKMCSCNEQCDNRVSQRPRDVPIEVFKTPSCGWGVRPAIDVKKGKVLGIYTGLVIPREDTDALSPELCGYRFDLDGDEGEGIEVPHPLYTVDSRLHGNWTRFINHSCSPNLEIYLVLHDTPPQSGLPFIAFVAREDISAHTEFTFDYDTSVFEQLAAATAKAKKKKKNKQVALMEMINATEGAKPCYCGSDHCRGYITL